MVNFKSYELDYHERSALQSIFYASMRPRTKIENPREYIRSALKLSLSLDGKLYNHNEETIDKILAAFIECKAIHKREQLCSAMQN